MLTGGWIEGGGLEIWIRGFITEVMSMGMVE